MKALTVYGPYDASYGDVPTPEAKGRFMTVKVEKAGLCATDISIWTGKSSFISDGLIRYPCRFGHEWSGTVVAVGENVSRFRVGDRIFSDSSVSCGVCPDCLAGNYSRCKHARSLGTVNCWDGCFAEYMSIPEYNAYRIPDPVPFEQAALIEPLSISLDAFHGASVDKTSTVTVIGTGAIGMGAVWIAKYLGAGRVISIGRTDSKLAVAAKLGADLLINAKETDAVEAVRALNGGDGCGLVVETSGNEAGLFQALRMVSTGGRVSVLSFYEKNLNGFPMDTIALNQISVVGGAGRVGNPERVAGVMAEYAVKPTPIITHHVPFSGMLDMLKNLDDYRNRIKIMIDFD
ncbi:MAG: alcohol dehydrogenase catalytic domain-containing protein [Clostridia bacterium]|nr:alcohol dehydrogenase catalytic domain-containing protein [Clostridia bacterium]